MFLSTLNRFALTTTLAGASLGAFAQQSAPLSLDAQAEKEYLEWHTKQGPLSYGKWEATHAAPRPVVPAAVMQRATELYRKPAAGYSREESYAPQWPIINERDIIWRKRVWRTIDMDGTIYYVPDRRGTSPNLAGILTGNALQGKCKVYGDDRFTKALTNDEIMTRIKEGTGAYKGNFDFAQIARYRIKEDWMYDGKSNQLIVRLIGIAPVLQRVASDGVVTETPAFWIYFPEVRAVLAQQYISTPAAKASSLDEWLDMHRYIGGIDKIGIGKMPGD